MELMQHQLDAIDLLGSGKILWGGVGSGKSAAVLGYYMKEQQPKDIYVITTAKKRDSLDWEGEAARFGIGTDRDATLAGTITIDSWNNIDHYLDVSSAFFIFDEQRLVGNGAWVKSFLKIAKRNDWILLSATPGDSWLDFAPVFIANGFYKNITDFKTQHVLYEPFSKYPKVRMYLKEYKLLMLRNDMLVEMPYMRETERFLNWLDVGYDLELFKKVYKERWNPYENKPIRDMAEVFRLMRRVVNSDPSRMEMVRKLTTCHARLIVFYNFNYELDILRELYKTHNVYEWNGHIKNDIKEFEEEDNWIYLVQYVAAAEAWNCTSTDAMILFSLTYSYKNFEQAQGRIDRLDTPFKNLFYYIFVSNSIIDRAIRGSLKNKKNFNERKFAREIIDIGEDGEKIEESCQI